METTQAGLAWLMWEGLMGEAGHESLGLKDDHEMNLESHTSRNVDGMFAEQYCGAEAFSKFDGEWDDLFNRSDGASPFLARAWATTFVSEGRLRGTPLLIAVWAEQKFVALLALSVRRAAGINIAEPIGTREPSYLGVLLDPQFRGAICSMADFIADESSIGILTLHDVSSDDWATNDLIVELGKRRFVTHSTRRRICPYIRLGCSFEEYLEERISPKRRKRLRYEERKLSNSADVRIYRYTATEINPAVLARIGAIHEASWMKRRGSPMLSEPFYQKLLLEMAKAGLGSAWLMTLDGHDAAFRYAFVTKGRLFSKWTAFDLRYEHLRHVGKVLTLSAIRDVCDDGVLSFDLMHGDSEWKLSWSNGFHDVNRIAAGRGFAGHLAVLWLAFLWWLANREWVRARWQAFRRARKIRSQLVSPSDHDNEIVR